MEALSKAELLSLLGAARAERERDFLMILVAYSHGLRASEVTRMQRDAVVDGHLAVARLKGSLRTVQPLVEDSNPLLNKHRRSLLSWLRYTESKGSSRSAGNTSGAWCNAMRRPPVSPNGSGTRTS